MAYGSTQQKISASPYTQPTAPLAALYGMKTSNPFVDRAASILGKPKQNVSGLGGAQGFSLLNPQPHIPQPISNLGGANPNMPPSDSINPGGAMIPYTSPGSSSPGATGTSSIGAGKAFKPPNINDLTLDPVYQQVVAAGQRNIGDASTAALASAKNALLGYGSIAPDAASGLSGLFQNDPNNPILGALSDTLTAQAAKNNPNATLNQLALNDYQRVGQLDADLNDKNLYYSSTRAAQLANDANTYRGEQATATSDLADSLAGIYANVLNAKQGALENQNNALQQAYQNALSLAALGGGAPSQDTGSSTSAPVTAPVAAPIAAPAAGAANSAPPFAPTIVDPNAAPGGSVSNAIPGTRIDSSHIVGPTGQPVLDFQNAVSPTGWQPAGDPNLPPAAPPIISALAQSGQATIAPDFAPVPRVEPVLRPSVPDVQTITPPSNGPGGPTGVNASPAGESGAYSGSAARPGAAISALQRAANALMAQGLTPRAFAGSAFAA
ncbi:MAG TPA: hypothetical protein VFM96_10160 [Gaiellaceae bacterium]|nr:hypothetical protein [Gaiellaceae bacterium]